jgi:hypothetical protein
MWRATKKLIVGISIFALSLGLVSCGSQGSPSISNEDEIAPGISAGQNGFNSACQAYAVQNYQGAAGLFREAGTMAEDGGDLDLARTAYAYADAIEARTEGFIPEQCNNPFP